MADRHSVIIMETCSTHISSQIPQYCVELGDQLKQQHQLASTLLDKVSYLENPSSVGARGEQSLDQLV